MKPIFLSVSSCCAASFLSKRLNINAATVNLAIWDTAGQERFHALGPIYYRDADGNFGPLSSFLFFVAYFLPCAYLPRTCTCSLPAATFAFISIQFLHCAHDRLLGALLVYDITDSESFVKVKNWVKELRKMVRNLT